MELNCKNITEAIKTSSKLLQQANELFDSGELDQMKKVLEEAERVLQIGPYKYRSMQRLNSSIPDNLRASEIAYISKQDCVDFQLSFDMKKISLLCRGYGGRLNYFDYDLETWERSKEVSTEAHDIGESILSKNGQDIIFVADREIHIVDKENGVQKNRKARIRIPSGISFLSESRDQNFIYVALKNGYARIYDKENGNNVSTRALSEVGKIFDLNDGTIAVISRNMKHLNLLDPYDFHTKGHVSTEEDDDSCIRDCVASVDKKNYLYHTEDEIFEYNIESGKTRCIYPSEATLYTYDEKIGLHNSIQKLVESPDGEALIVLLADCKIAVIDKEGRFITKTKTTYRNVVSFYKMIALPDGSVAIAGTQGFAEKWGTK